MFPENQYYWEIILYSGETIEVKPNPKNIGEIQRKLADQHGSITTPTRSIIVKDIKDFRITSKRYTDQKLVEGQAQAFNEPVYTERVIGGIKYEGIAAKYVKKSVPRRRWDTHYRFMNNYKLEDNDSFVTFAFIMPVHNIDYSQMEDLTPDEELRVSRMINT